MIDFSIPPELEVTRQRTTAFMDEFVYPNESVVAQRILKTFQRESSGTV